VAIQGSTAYLTGVKRETAGGHNGREHHMSQLGTYLLFYGLYFGVMGRDFAEVQYLRAG
jgi:hypothetical protein